MSHTPSLFSRKPYWAARFGVAPVLPMSRAEMDDLGWDACDVILISGDAYIDHPSFGTAIIGRLLEAQGFRVGVIAQPDWNSVEAFKQLGRPNLFWGVTSGNMDSMVNRYTADRKIRSDDAYSPDNRAGLRPDRATIVYSQRCREAYPDIPIVLGGIEASLRRVAHFDYWQEKIRRSILLDARADYLCFGNAERAIVEIAHFIAQKENTPFPCRIRGVAVVGSELPSDVELIDLSGVDAIPTSAPHYQESRSTPSTLLLPSYEAVRKDQRLFAHSIRLLYQESRSLKESTIVQAHGNQWVWINPPAIPLSSPEMDALYALPFSRLPHPHYGEQKIPAFEMIRHSVTLMRGCFGGCSFCSITLHEGRRIQNRSRDSVIEEIETIRDQDSAFTGTISDLGGPSANMYQMACRDPEVERHCRRLSCLYPRICPNLDTSHAALIALYNEARQVAGVKRVSVASGVRYDLALRSPKYLETLIQHFVGGYLKVAPEHTEAAPLKQMKKPSIETYHQFEKAFEQISKKAGKEQYMIPYFIAAHPGCSDLDMLNLALWLKENGFRPDQVQTFYPTPLTLASTAWYTELDLDDPELKSKLTVPKGGRQRRLHKAFIRYHDPANQRILNEALIEMGRSDLIGFSKRHLVRPLHRSNRDGGWRREERKRKGVSHPKRRRGSKQKTRR